MKAFKQVSKTVLSLMLALGMLITPSFANSYGMESHANQDFEISNPYKNVDWEEFKQYKADFHAHSTNSDGGNLTRDMVEDHYKKGYDILAMTDHNYVTRGWENAGEGAMTMERKQEILKGVGRDGKPMIDVTFGDEQSKVDHINTFWTDWNNSDDASMSDTLRHAENLGGISHINHLGRYTKAYKPGKQEKSNDPKEIQKYIDLFSAYPSCVGMEIINKLDNESRQDRVMWDNILKVMMPKERNVWGFANDDTHSLNATGYAFNMMLMPELTEKATRTAMETGAFYAVSRISRPDGINSIMADSTLQPGSGKSYTTYLMKGTTPVITNIEVNQKKDTITITGKNYDKIEWIADGKVIATGNTIDLNDYEGKVNSYIRAQLKSQTGIAFTQPFALKTKAKAFRQIKVEEKSKSALLAFDTRDKSGKGYQVYLSKEGVDGDYQYYRNVSFNENGVVVKGLTADKEYHAYIVYLKDGIIVERSEPIAVKAIAE
ncbi:PHP domain-containing protein [Guggenheimella bovis]